MDKLSDVLNSVAKGLSGKAEALLIFGLGLVSVAAKAAGATDMYAFGFPLALYLLYLYRAKESDKHEAKQNQLAFDTKRAELAAKVALDRSKVGRIK